MKTRLFSTLAISLTLAACVTTGGYGPGSSRPIRADDQPYLGEFAKNSAWIKFDPRVYEQAWVGDQPLAWAVGDFYGDGSASIFAATQRYEGRYAYETIKESPAKFNSLMQLFHVDKKTGKQELTWSMIGCLHPRKAAAADFNQDGKLDVVVTCHGYNREQSGMAMPGEYSFMLTNDGKGGFTASKFGFPNSFYHGTAVGDVNGDGYPDIVVAAPLNSDVQVYFWMNQKDGTFKKDTSRVRGRRDGNTGFVALVDVDGDGILDLIAAGEESSGADNVVLFGNKDGKFGPERISIPSVRDQGCVYQVLPVTNNGERVLYVLRTSDGSNGLYGYNKGMSIQAVNLSTGKETIYRSNRSWLSDILPATKNGQNGVAPYDFDKGSWFISNTWVDAPK